MRYFLLKFNGDRLRAPTLFEMVEQAGYRAASINYLVSRGRTRHTIKHDYGPLRRVAKRVGVHSLYGPDHLYFGELYGSLRPILPQVGFKRPRDWGGGHIARWLMRNPPLAECKLTLPAQALPDGRSVPSIATAPSRIHGRPSLRSGR